MSYPLVDFSSVDHIFEPLLGLHVGRLEIIENAEDELICIAVRNLIDHYAIKGWELEPEPILAGSDPDRAVQAFLVYGGTNADGLISTLPDALRRVCANRAIVYLPGSAENIVPDRRCNEILYSHDPGVLGRNDHAKPAPDLCLTLTEFFQMEPRSEQLGVFFQDGSSHNKGDVSLGDPLALSPNAYFYVALASNFEHLVTDRCRFAMAGLFAGRQVTLLPDANGLNREIYDHWLRARGCEWREEMEIVDYDSRAVKHRMLKWFVASDPGHVKRSAIPQQVAGCSVCPVDDAAEIITAGGRRLPCSYSVYLIWALCDGRRTVLDVIAAVIDHVSGPIAALAADVDKALQLLLALHGIELVWPYPARHGPARQVPYQDAPVLVDVHPRHREKGATRLSATLDDPVRGPSTLWYEVPTTWEHVLTERADPFLLAALYVAMLHKRGLIVRGAPVSASLLSNVSEFQRAWRSRYSQYGYAEIDAQSCADELVPGNPSISCYSLGVDSSFTLLQHLSANGEHTRPLGAAMLALGLDIPAQDEEGFTPLVALARRLLDDKSLPLITLRTNIRASCQHYQYFHAPHIAGCLTLLSGGFSSGLIPSSFTYRGAIIEGSNPLTDHLLGSRSFAIEHHGAGFDRLQKIERLLQWPQAVDHIRVCWRLPQREKNCGRCWKCLQTAMLFRACGHDPDSLRHVRDEDIDGHVRQVWLRGPGLFESALDAATRHGIKAPWLKTIKTRLAAHSAPEKSA